MINFHRVTDINDTYYRHMAKLYESAFPYNERRTIANLNKELDSNSGFEAYAVILDEEFVGILNYWVFQNFHFVEHFAIEKFLRNKKIGTQTLKLFKAQSKLPIVLEVEMPAGDESLKRIRFYDKLGFKVMPHYYAQPPYEKGGFLTPMLLMSDDYHFANNHFEKIKNRIYKDVYRFKEPTYN